MKTKEQRRRYAETRLLRLRAELLDLERGSIGGNRRMVCVRSGPGDNESTRRLAIKNTKINIKRWERELNSL